MIRIVQEITKELRTIESESYLETNTKSKIKYPYLTFQISGENLENAEGFYIDLDIWDNTGEYSRILGIEGNLKKYLKERNLLLDDMLMRFFYIRSNAAPTEDDLIKRRNLQFYCRVYRRNE